MTGMQDGGKDEDSIDSDPYWIHRLWIGLSEQAKKENVTDSGGIARCRPSQWR